MSNTKAPGGDSISFRAGDFLSFRDALLKGQSNEEDLRGYYPSVKGDLALALIEWWAYLADILTFYNERIANASYVGTASFDDEVERLTRLLGFKRAPGLGAKAILAALVSGARPIVLPAGMAVQSKPGPGQEPQIFELSADTIALPGGAVDVDVLTQASPSDGASLLLEGKITQLQGGDWLLLVGEGRTMVVCAQAASIEKDSRGRARTRISLTEKISPLSGRASCYKLLKSNAVMGLCPYLQTIEAPDELHLASRLSTLMPQDPVLIEGGAKPRLVHVGKYAETAWSIVFDLSVLAQNQQVQEQKVPITVLHGVLKLNDNEMGVQDYPSDLRIRYGFREVGTLAEPEPTSPVTGPSLALRIVSSSLPAGGLGVGMKALLEDSTGNGVLVRVQSQDAQGNIAVVAADGRAFSLIPPLRLLTNLLEVSRGKTILKEVLGSGDSSKAGQSFMLAKGPLSYFPPEAGGQPGERLSTLRVYVNDIEWLEVPSFYGQAPDARVFVVYEDEAQQTWVRFGDGVYGSRLPTGAENVIASYRYGRGEAVPLGGALTTLLTPQHGLVSVRNPIAASGGADAEAGASLRKNAPRSVLALGRAVSVDDYEALALLVPGVTRARAALSWHEARQQRVVTVWVHGSTGVQENVAQTFAALADPNRACEIRPAVPLPLRITLRVLYNPHYLPENVEAAVRRALLDSDSGLFSVKQTGIGIAVYRSRIYTACLVRGVLAVHGLQIGARRAQNAGFLSLDEESAFIQPDSDQFLLLDKADLHITMEEGADVI